MCYRTADCFLFYTYLKKFIAICYTQTHTGHSHSKKLSLQWLSTVTSNARENRYKFYTRERQSRECTAKKYRGKIHLHTKQRAGILPPSDFHLISSRGASCGCWEGAPSYPQHADGRLWMSKIFPDFEIQRARAGILPPSAIFNSRCDTWKFKVRETLKFEEETISNSCSRLHEKLPPNL